MSDIFFPWHFNGQNALRYRPIISLDNDQFYLRDSALDYDAGPFRFDQLYFVELQSNVPVYGLEDHEGWRLGLAGDIPRSLALKLPAQQKYGRWIDHFGFWPAAAGMTMISIASVAIILSVPQYLAPIIPYSWEKKMGEAMVGDLGGRICNDPQAQIALDEMLAKLDPINAKLPQDQQLRVRVANIPIANAAALPGGEILIFNGLFDLVETQDELAGIVAHEIGHVRKRHVMQSLLRQLGLSVVLGGLDGYSSSGLNTVLATSYGRDAESEADQYSIDTMRRADISPLDTAQFFARLARKESPSTKGTSSGQSIDKDKQQASSGQAASAKPEIAKDSDDQAIMVPMPQRDSPSDPKTSSSQAEDEDMIEEVLNYLSSHPLSEDRYQKYKSSAVKGHAYRPVISDRQWQDLQNICDGHNIYIRKP